MLGIAVLRGRAFRETDDQPTAPVAIIDEDAERRFFPGVEWWQCVAAHLCTTAVLVLMTALLIRRLARREGEGVVAPEAAAQEALSR